MLTVLTPTCTHNPLSDNTRPARKILPRPPTNKDIPQEGNRPNDITEKRKEDSTETPRETPDTPAEQSHRALKDHQNNSTYCKGDPQEGEGLRLTPHCKLI
jgi:hypothetical protein